MLHNLNNISGQQKSSLDDLFVFGVQTDSDNIIKFAQVDFDLAAVALVSEHEQREGGVRGQQQSVRDQLDGGLEVRLGLLEALVLQPLRQLLHDHQDAIQNSRPLGYVDDDCLVLQHFDAAVVEGTDVVEALVWRVFDDVAHGGAEVADDLEVVLDCGVALHLDDAVADVFEVVAGLEPLLPILLEVVADVVLRLLAESDEEGLDGVEGLVGDARVGLQRVDQRLDQRLDVVQQRLRSVLAHAGQRPTAGELEVVVSARVQEFDDELTRVPDESEERIVTWTIGQRTYDDNCTPDFHDVVRVDLA